ncbi:MAG: hypothetical protein JSS93_04715 [Bacteroidetes bacterium]|nr:hypothetical protein [Bacteroidota bacterium]
MKNHLLLFMVILSCTHTFAQSPDINELASCANGLQVILKSSYLGSCQSQSGNGVTGYYYHYSLEVKNRTSNSVTLDKIFFYFYGRTPFSISCLTSRAGESTSITYQSHTFAGFENKIFGEFDLMFYSQNENIDLINRSQAQAKNVCNGTTQSLSSTSIQGNYNSQSFNRAQSQADDLVKQGKEKEAIALLENYKNDHPEETSLIAKKQEAIRSQLNKRLDQEQKTREKQEVAAGAAEVGMMYYLGGFIYANVGKDKPQNIQTANTWRFNFTQGFSFALMPTYNNEVISNVVGYQNTTTQTIENGSVATLNYDIGLQFWPYYGNNFGIGIMANGFGGYMPLPGSNASYRYQYGGQAFLGLPEVQLNVMYLLGDRGFSKSYRFSSSIASTEITDTGKGAAAFSRLMLGPRFSFGSDDFKKKHLEAYYIMENYPNMKQIKATGVNVTYYAHNRLKIYAEYFPNAARMGTLNDGYTISDGVTNNSTLVLFGVIRTIDVFGN